MNPLKLVAAIICVMAIVSIVMIIKLLAPTLGATAWIIALIDAATSVGIAFYLWNKPYPPPTA